jgi:hypothetical protein
MNSRFVPMPRHGERVEGLSRSSIYREAAAGRIVLKKYGRSVLVDVESARALVRSLPAATIKPEPARTAA